MVQRLAARYTTNRLGNTSSVSSMLDHLQWESLNTRRTKIQLTLFFKVVHSMIDIPADKYLIPSTTRTRSAHSNKFRQFSPSTDSFKYSFFPCTVPLWNSLPAAIAEAPSLVSCKEGLSTFSLEQVRCLLTFQGGELCCQGRKGPGTCERHLGKLSSFSSFYSLYFLILFPIYI